MAAPNLHASVTKPYTQFIYHNLAKRSFNSFFKIYCLHLKCAKGTAEVFGFGSKTRDVPCHVRRVHVEVRACVRVGDWTAGG